MIRILSDLHLGANPNFAHPEREKILLEQLANWSDTQILVLAGDVFEFWMEYNHVVPKRHFEFIFALKKLIQAGVQVHYISGNHDFELGLFFKNLGVICHDSGHMVLEWNSRKYFIGHGDGWAKSDWKYRIVRRIIRHPFNQFLYRILHPDWGIGLAYWVGSRSRAHGCNEVIPWEEYKEWAQEKINEGYCCVIQGHLHSPQIVDMIGGVWVVNGPWLDQLCWTEITDNSIIQKRAN